MHSFRGKGMTLALSQYEFMIRSDKYRLELVIVSLGWMTVYKINLIKTAKKPSTIDGIGRYNRTKRNIVMRQFIFTQIQSTISVDYNFPQLFSAFHNVSLPSSFK